MQQRQPRLGDIIDDYCPRERRVTNHAVVAMVGHEVKQSRCTTCESEHEYKHAKVPPGRKKKETVGALQEELLKAPDAPRAPRGASSALAASPGPESPAPAERQQAADELLGSEPEQPIIAERPRQRTRTKAASPVAAAEPAPPEPSPSPPAPPPLPAPAATPAASASSAPVPAPATSTSPAGEPEPPIETQEGSEDEGPVHRRLIRATLPRPEGQVVRPTPQFTMRQPAGRPPGFGGGRARSARPHSAAGGRPHGAAGGGKGGRAGSFSRGGGGSDAFGRGRGRDAQHTRQGRHPHAGHPSRPGKKHSK